MADSSSRGLSVRNLLLSALPPSVQAELLPKFTSVTLPNWQILHAAEKPIEFVYFLETGVVSLVATLEDGAVAEIGLVGKEGMVGTPLLSGVETPFTEAMVQVSCRALRMAATLFRQELDRNPPFRKLLFRYNEFLTAQISQISVCNGRHNLERRFARWLLMAHDRVIGDSIPVTQEFLAMMLGVHRPRITVTAGALQRAGVIRYANAIITISDRTRLEAASCECYSAVQRRSQRLFGQEMLPSKGIRDVAQDRRGVRRA